MNKKIKILLISPTCFPSKGGIQSYIKNVLFCLKEYVDIDILTSNIGFKKFDKKIIDGFLIQEVPAIAPNDSFYISPWLVNFFKKIVKNYDIVHFHGYHNLFPLVMFFAGKKPIVMTPHYHTKPKKRTRDLLFKIYNLIFGRFLFSRSNHIIVNNKISKGVLLKQFKICPSKITILHEGVINHCRYSKTKKGRINNPNFLYVGRFERNKGIFRVLEVFTRISRKYKEATLNFVGSGTEKENLLRLIKMKKLEKKVKIYSNIPDSELSKLYCKADIFLMLSDYESFGIALAEAIASGIPSIGVNRGGVVEYAINRENCLLVNNPDEYEQINQLTQELIENDKLRNKISKNGIKLIDNFSWKKNALLTLKIYKKLIDEET